MPNNSLAPCPPVPTHLYPTCAHPTYDHPTYVHPQCTPPILTYLYHPPMPSPTHQPLVTLLAADLTQFAQDTLSPGTTVCSGYNVPWHQVTTASAPETGRSPHEQLFSVSGVLQKRGPKRAVWHSPSLATSPMGTLCFWAMYPKKEKTTKPEEKLVSEFTEVVTRASLWAQDSRVCRAVAQPTNTTYLPTSH